VTLQKRQIWLIVSVLILIQALQTAYVVHRESLTFDEDDHMYAGYMMWHTGDYGLNPEHPPLVKLLATLPILGENLWLPPLTNREFKVEAYLNGRDWLARNDGDSQRLVFRMRLAAGLLAIGLSLVVFFAAREWFGDVAGLAALALVSFDPNIVGHSALVTTDIGVSLFFLASIYAFYRYVRQPSLSRLALAGVVSGLLLATKHSGVLLAPMLILLIGWEVATAAKGTRGKLALRLSGAFGAIVVVGVVVLWAFYGFRYAARPAGLAMSTSLAEYVGPLSHFNATGVMAIAHLHLLPESYLIGLVDVKRMAQWYPTFAFGKVYAHGQWWYFPAVILVKTTLGLLALVAAAFFAIFTGRLRKGRELAFILIPAVFYLFVAIAAGMDIGARHILPVDTFMFILAAGGITESLVLAKAAAEGINYQPGWLIAVTTTVKVFIDIFIGVWAFILAYIWTNHINVKPDGEKAKASEIWARFPKFILGFVVTFVAGLALALGGAGPKLASAIGEANTFRVIFFILTFFSIGVLTDFRKLWREGLGKLAAVYLVSLFGFVIWVGLIISWLFFAGVKPPLVG